MEDPRAHAEFTTRFHELVVELAGNKTLTMLVRMLHDIVEMHAASRAWQQASTPSRRQKVIRSFSKLVDLIEAREGEKAEQHWREHFEASGPVVLEPFADKTVLDLFE